MNPSNALIALIAACGIGAVALFNPKVRQALRIRTNALAQGSTTAVERLADKKAQLEANLPVLRRKVSDVVGRVTTAQNELDSLNQVLADAKVDYRDVAARLKTNPEDTTAQAIQQTLLTKIQSLTSKVEAQTATVNQLKKISVDLKEEYESTRQALSEFGDQIQIAEGQSELTEALRKATDFKYELGQLKSGVGDAGRDLKRVEQDLNVALADADMVKGNQGEQGLRQKKLAETQRQLEAELGLSPVDDTATGA